MFVKNFNLQHPRRHYELFLPSRPYRGEPPTVAGFLLYPDTPAKMETTSREAFCSRPALQQERGKGDHDALNTQQESRRSSPTASTQTGKGNSSREDRRTQRDKGDQTAVKKEQDAAEMVSQYQKDFPPPFSFYRRGTPARPQLDNIGINPAFRIEFNTVQRETYPGWPIMNSQCAGRLRVATSGHPNMTSE
ncbi:uncharacterized protein si:dkeyp-69c1.9 [Xyrichtys novacula]|uniref:Uncharacterized protein si:dkeyp-69c1.9 n=1 Tax=Xyrichtys novacula TaxID=13765 RepID=A0AAV1FSK7_XYRNO|nr:uncharacterized protein si:dkeyp-69c1.9 [Xyrichtys novacula]